MQNVCAERSCRTLHVAQHYTISECHWKIALLGLDGLVGPVGPVGPVGLVGLAGLAGLVWMQASDKRTLGQSGGHIGGILLAAGINLNPNES